MLSVKTPELTKEEKFAIKQLNRSVNRSKFICNYYSDYHISDWESFWKKYKQEKSKQSGK